MAETRDLVKRLLDTPDIARVIPQLPPQVLHQLIDHCGLEGCAEILALAAPRQLRGVLDIDLWRAPTPGADQALDSQRFGQWLEVLLELGATPAGDVLAAMDAELVIGGFAEHVAVFDAAAVAPFTSLDGESVPGRAFGSGQICQLGGFVVEGRQSLAWDAIVELLAHLQGERPNLFQRIMRGCVALSDGAREQDGFHDLLEERDQHRFDLAAAREDRRDPQGYVAPAQARAFLETARQLSLDGAQPPLDSVARACLRTISAPPLSDSDAPAPDDTMDGPEVETPLPVSTKAVTDVIEILSQAGVVAPSRALLTARTPDDSRLSLVRGFAASQLTAQEELGFLANALLTGCAFQNRAFTVQEASDAVVATCNLGLENWPTQWPARDLVTVFQVGWAILHRELCRSGAEALIAALATLECSDRDVQWALHTLRRELTRRLDEGEPWRARQALDTILMLDAPAWAVLRALLDECPTIHAVVVSRRVLSVDPAAVTFVARNAEIAAARTWLATLTSALTS
jgi:hypothetical protein